MDGDGKIRQCKRRGYRPREEQLDKERERWDADHYVYYICGKCLRKVRVRMIYLKGKKGEILTALLYGWRDGVGVEIRALRSDGTTTLWVLDRS